MKKITNSTVYLILWSMMFAACFSNKSISIENVKVIEVDREDEFSNPVDSKQKGMIEVILDSSFGKYYVEVYSSEKLLYEDTVISKIHYNDLKFEKFLSELDTSSNEIDLNIILYPVSSKVGYSIKTKLSPSKNRFYIRHTFIDTKRPVSEFEVNSGFIYEGKEYTNYAFVSSRMRK